MLKDGQTYGEEKTDVELEIGNKWEKEHPDLGSRSHYLDAVVSCSLSSL